MKFIHCVFCILVLIFIFSFLMKFSQKKWNYIQEENTDCQRTSDIFEPSIPGGDGDGNKSATMCIITAVSGNYKANLESIDHLDVDGFVFGGGSNVVTRGTRWFRDDTYHFRHDDPFMQAKYYKTQWHKIPRLKKYNIVVWMDATLKLKKLPPIPDVDSIVAYHHQIRQSTHSEIDVSVDSRYQPYIKGLRYQKKDRANVPWLSITCWVVNRRGPRVYAMNDAWFRDIIQYSPQDQVSFPSACEAANVPIRLLNDGISHKETAFYLKKKHLTPYSEYRTKGGWWWDWDYYRLLSKLGNTYK